MLLDTPSYMNACQKHLASSLTLDDGSVLPEGGQGDQAKEEITAVLNKAHKAGIISDQELKHMDPSDIVAARFQPLPKVHKDHVPGEVLPLRLIISSGSGSITEKISHYVQHNIKDISKKHASSYLEDTLDLLQFLQDIGELPDGAFLATIDVSTLYSDIQKEEGVEAVSKALETQEYKSVPADFILELLDLIFKYNVFTQFQVLVAKYY